MSEVERALGRSALGQCRLSAVGFQAMNLPDELHALGCRRGAAIAWVYQVGVLDEGARECGLACMKEGQSALSACWHGVSAIHRRSSLTAA